MLEHFFEQFINNWFMVILTLIIVMILLNYATSMLEEQLSVLGKKLKIPGSVRGATFDAISSSLPEFLTAMVGLIMLKEKGLEVGIGTISGSAIFNILIIPAFVLMFYKGKKIKVSLGRIKQDSLFYLGSIIVFLIGLFFNQLELMGFVLLGIYGIYLYILYKESQKHKKQNEEEIKQAFEEVKNTKVNYIFIIISLILIYLGVEASVTSATWIGNTLNISTLVVALILLAGITSIPDTLLSVKSSKKGDADAGMSNAVGSNIFDICIGLGLPILIGTLAMGLKPEVNFNDNIGVFGFLMGSVLIYFLLLSKKNLGKKDGIYLLLVYLVFIAYIVYIATKI